MGSALTVIHNYRTGFGPDVTKTRSKDWITMHSELSGLSVVEVERLWRRFQQLGCDEDGVISEQFLREESHFKGDIFMRNLLVTIAIDDRVHFHTFLNYMRWAQEATDEEKLKAIFSFFNSGHSLGKDLFSRILKRVYPDKDADTILHYTDVVFTKVTSPSGSMGYSDFKRLCGGDQSDIARVLEFKVVPREIIAEAHSKFSAKWASQKHDNDKDRSGAALVSDESFEELSSRLANTDWKPLAAALGFTMAQVRRLTGGQMDDRMRILTILMKWRDSNPSDANCSSLREALSTLRPDLMNSVYGSATL